MLALENGGCKGVKNFTWPLVYIAGIGPLL